MNNSIQEIFFKFLNQFEYDENDLDYTLIPKYAQSLQALAEVSNSGVQIFDIHQKQMVFFSSNIGKALGYAPADYEALNYKFFETKMHPDEQYQLALKGVSSLKLFNAFSNDEKLNHKAIFEFKMLNAEGKYVRVIDQYQVLELDKKGQIWLMLSMVDISPNQETDSPIKCQILNFRTGHFIPFDTDEQPALELTKRELEILKLVKQGYLSKEISDKLSISVHTVNTHRYRVLEKLGANNSFEAVVFASKYGLLD
jgi:DNA-binding CsgD family transcriptional regulator/PAS domain-containing protein